MANIMIYGSCVSRDAYGKFAEEHDLVAYVARQSVISAMSPATSLLPGVDLNSGFQNRMLAGDLASNLLQTIRRNADAIDLLLIDLTDERLGVHKLPDGSFVTRSTELVKSQRLTQLAINPPFLSIGTERHTKYWSRAATGFYARLERLGLKEKTLVINTPWAMESFEGTAVPLFRRIPTEEMNIHLNAYAEIVRGLGFTVVDMPPALAVSSSSHKWGIAPYHYGTPAYLWICDQVTSALR